MILDIKTEYEKRKKELKEKDLRDIVLVTILTDNNEASIKYVSNKEKLLKELNIECVNIRLNNPKQEELEEKIKELNRDKKITGIILELPLSKNLDTNKAIALIDNKKDVDGLTNENLGKLIKNEDTILPCTVYAVSKIISIANVDLEGKKVVIIGRSILVGKPLSIFLTNKNATCTLCHSKTKNLKEISKTADILIVAIGKKHFITKDYVKDGALVIDVGTNFENGKVYGDVDENVSNETNIITHVPNGVGLMTKLCVVENLIKLKQS